MAFESSLITIDVHFSDRERSLRSRCAKISIPFRYIASHCHHYPVTTAPYEIYIRSGIKATHNLRSACATNMHAARDSISNIFSLTAAAPQRGFRDLWFRTGFAYLSRNIIHNNRRRIGGENVAWWGDCLAKYDSDFKTARDFFLPLSTALMWRRLHGKRADTRFHSSRTRFPQFMTRIRLIRQSFWGKKEQSQPIFRVDTFGFVCKLTVLFLIVSGMSLASFSSRFINMFVMYS